MCKCGFKKADHVQSAGFRAAPKALPVISARPFAAAAAPPKPAVVTAPKPVVMAAPALAVKQEVAEEENVKKACDSYEINMMAKDFGLCKVSC